MATRTETEFRQAEGGAAARRPEPGPTPSNDAPAVAPAPRHRARKAAVVVIALLAIAGGAVGYRRYVGDPSAAPVAAPPPTAVTVGRPLVRSLGRLTDFLGQFSAVDQVEVRAQVGGTLSEIRFVDGQVVKKGDPLFVIDKRPYEIKLRQAQTALDTAKARLTLTSVQLSRAQQLRESTYGTVESVDQRVADQDAARAAVESATQTVQDAQLDLDYCQVAAPFTGRISNHLASVGSLISGSRAASSPTTLLTTLVSTDPIHLDFDMSEAEYLEYKESHPDGAASGAVSFVLSDGNVGGTGVLDFLDNAVNRGSGTIHARATVRNRDLRLTPGEFAHLKLTTGKPRDVLLVPDQAILSDQSQRMAMTVVDGDVVPKIVQLGGHSEGLRIVLGGLSKDDSVIIDGLARLQPGAKVAPEQSEIRPTADR